MFPAWLGPMLGGLGSLAGGLGGLFGGGGGSQQSDGTFLQNQFSAQMNWNREQAAMQKEFAQNGLRWRVEDAKAAGLHPLAAIGAGGASYTPTILAGTGEPSPGRSSNRDVGSSLAAMGQGLGRAISATQTKEERILTAFEIKRQEQQIQQGDLMNQKLMLDIAQMANPGPAFPNVTNRYGEMVTSQGNIPSGLTQPGIGSVYKMPEVNTQERGNPGTESGTAHPYSRFTNTGSGLIPIPNKDLGYEDEFLAPGMSEHLMRTRLFPIIGGNTGQPTMSQMQREFGKDVIGMEYRQGQWMPIRKSDYRGHYPRGYGAPSSVPYFAP